MEKATRSKGGNILAFLVNSASFSFPHIPRSPGRDGAAKHAKSFHHRNAFSGPIISIIPEEARRKEKAGVSGFRTPEPTSPKVSCIGQIKQKKKKPCKAPPQKPPLPPKPERRQNSLVQRMFRRRSRSRRGLDDAKSLNKGRPSAPARAPAIGQIKRFTSGRGALRDFDWKVAAEGTVKDGEIDGADEEDTVIVAHSAPLVLGSCMVASEPRKEVNLWRRRPMAPPGPLQVS